jgi:hypothetical protein
MSLEIKPFDKQKDSNDTSVIKIPFSMYISAAKSGGKSTLMLNLLTNKNYLKNKFNQIHWFSPTAKLDEKIHSVLDNQNIIVKNDKLIKLLKRLKDKSILDDGISRDLHYLERENEVEYHSNINVETVNEIITSNKLISETYGKAFSDKILLIFDDIIESKFFTKEIMKKLMFKSRHYNVSMIITSQSYFQLPKALRLNMSYNLVFETGNRKELERIYEENNGGLSNKGFFQMMSDIFDIPFNFLVIDYFRIKKERFWEQFLKPIDLSEYKNIK